MLLLFNDLDTVLLREHYLEYCPVANFYLSMKKKGKKKAKKGKKKDGGKGKIVVTLFNSATSDQTCLVPYIYQIAT